MLLGVMFYWGASAARSRLEHQKRLTLKTTIPRFAWPADPGAARKICYAVDKDRAAIAQTRRGDAQVIEPALGTGMRSIWMGVSVRGWRLFSIGLVAGCLLAPSLTLGRVSEPCPEPCGPRERIDRANATFRLPLLEVPRWLNRQLVGTTPKGKFRLAVAPRFVNVTESSLIAFNFRLYYGITSKWMTGFRLRVYSDNPFTDDERSEPGLGDIILETKYRLPSWRAYDIEAAIGLKVLIPLTQDEDRSDGVVHVVPGITLIRPIFQWAPVHLYTRLGIDIATEDIVRTPVADEIQETFFLWAWGLVYPSRGVLVFFDVEWQTNVFIDGGDRHNILVTPGVRYEVPNLRALPGLWTVEAGLRLGFVDAEELYTIGFRLVIQPFKPKPAKSPQARLGARRRPNLAALTGALISRVTTASY